jgi:hypothetical protein
MIKILIENNYKSPDNFLSEITDKAMDETLRLSKEYLESEHKNATCVVHKSKSKGTITLKSNGNETVFEYSDFCCSAFRDKLKE